MIQELSGQALRIFALVPIKQRGSREIWRALSKRRWGRRRQRFFLDLSCWTVIAGAWRQAMKRSRSGTSTDDFTSLSACASPLVEVNANQRFLRRS
jgi:hypothetical protein